METSCSSLILRGKLVSRALSRTPRLQLRSTGYKARPTSMPRKQNRFATVTRVGTSTCLDDFYVAVPSVPGLGSLSVIDTSTYRATRKFNSDRQLPLTSGCTLTLQPTWLCRENLTGVAPNHLVTPEVSCSGPRFGCLQRVGEYSGAVT